MIERSPTFFGIMRLTTTLRPIPAGARQSHVTTMIVPLSGNPSALRSHDGTEIRLNTKLLASPHIVSVETRSLTLRDELPRANLCWPRKPPSREIDNVETLYA